MVITLNIRILKKEFLMKIKLLTLLACTFLFSGAGFASTLNALPKTPSKAVQNIPVTSYVGGNMLGFGKTPSGELVGHPEIHIMYARDQIINALKTRFDTLQSRIGELNKEIAVIKSARNSRPPIQTISFADLKEIFNEAKVAK
jgi:hypothetical protein